MKKLAKAGIGLAAVAAISAAGIVAVNAWGPERKTFTMEKPADYVTFNSITNNAIGDERYFVAASEYTGNSNNNVFTDNTTVEDGKEYVVRMYVHNNAGENLGLVAENVRAYVILPTDLASSITVSGKIYSSNAKPTTVWDETHFSSKNGEKFNLAYVDGSAKYYNFDQNNKLRTFSLDDLNDSNDLFTSKGRLLGYDQMDGKIPGCNNYSGYLTFHVKAQFQKVVTKDIELQKEVKILGTDTWSEKVTAKSGDTVRYRIHAKNIGNVALENFTVRDVLPTGLTYVKGSTTVANSINPQGAPVNDGIVTEQGLNLGTYNAGAGAWIYFNATVDQAVSEKCDDSLLRNIAQSSAKTMTKTVEDTADVFVNGKICEDNFKINKTVQLNGGKEWFENVTAKAGDTVRYRIQFKNTGSTTLKNVVIRDILPNGISYKKGTTILYNADNTKGKKLGDGIVTANGVNIGDYAKGTEATVYFYATVSASLSDNCYDSTLTNVVKGKYNNDSKTEKSDTAKVAVKGKTCKDPDLPKTGATTIVTGIFGTAAVATAAGYYIVSRKKLN